MSAGLDTSVVLRLLVGVPEAQATAARMFVDGAARSGRGPLGVSDLVIAESYHALIHHYRVPHPEAVHALLQLVSEPHVRATGVARQMLASNIRTEPGFADRMIHADYDAAGLVTATFDRRMARLHGVQRLGAPSAR